MNNSFKHMQAKIRTLDCIIEVHDARIPFSGRNPKFENFKSIPRILVLNKEDLIDNILKNDILNKISNIEPNIVDAFFTVGNKIANKSINKIIPSLISRKNTLKNLNSIDIMVIGVPNVGKSTILNSFRKIHMKRDMAAEVGPYAGVTRTVSNRIKIHSNPNIYIFDTPGIMSPHIENIEAAMRLALCATFRDSMIGEQEICDYLLFWLNRQNLFHTYTNSQHLNLPFPSNFELKEPNDKDTYLNRNIYSRYVLNEPTDDINELLIRIAIANDMYIKIVLNYSLLVAGSSNSSCISHTCSYELKPDINRAAHLFLKVFRLGKLGKFLLDNDHL